MNVQVLPLKDLRNNDDNPRAIKTKKFKSLVESVLSFPKMLEVRPIIINSDNKILGGNMRYKALLTISNYSKEELIELVEKTIEEQKQAEITSYWLEWLNSPTAYVAVSTNFNESDEREFIIKDNVSFGHWDLEIINKRWDNKNLSKWGVTGNINSLKLREENEINDVNIDTDVVYLDLYEIKYNNITHRLLCGDSSKSEDLNILMDKNHADMIFTDPPYDLEDCYSDNLFKISKKDCHIFIMNSDRNTIKVANKHLDYFNKIFGVDFRLGRLVSNLQPLTRLILIAEFNKGKSKFVNLHDGFSTLVSSIVTHKKDDKHSFGFDQAKRVDLPANFIRHYSDKNDIVVDVFGGAGSTMVACIELERICYMCEILPENCQRILNRIKSTYPDVVINKLNYGKESI